MNLRRPRRRRLKSLRNDYTAGCCQVEGALKRKYMIIRFLECLDVIRNAGHAFASALEACSGSYFLILVAQLQASRDIGAKSSLK